MDNKSLGHRRRAGSSSARRGRERAARTKTTAPVDTYSTGRPFWTKDEFDTLTKMDNNKSLGRGLGAGSSSATRGKRSSVRPKTTAPIDTYSTGRAFWTKDEFDTLTKMDKDKSMGRGLGAGSSNATRGSRRSAGPIDTYSSRRPFWTKDKFDTLTKMDKDKSLGRGLGAGSSNATRGNRRSARSRTTLVQMDNKKPMARNRRVASPKTTPGTSFKREKIEQNWYKATVAPKDGVPAVRKEMNKKIDLDSSFEIFQGKRKKVSFVSELDNQDTCVLSQDDFIDFPDQRKRNKVPIVSELSKKSMARNRRAASSKTTPGNSLRSSLKSGPLTRSGYKREKIEENLYKTTDAPKDGVPDLRKKMDKKIDLDSSFEIFEGKKKRFSFLPDLESQDTFVLSQDDIIEFPKQGKRNKVSFDSELESQDTFVSSQDDIVEFPKQGNRNKVSFDSELSNKSMARNHRAASSKTTPGTSLRSSLKSGPLTRSGYKREKIEENLYKTTDAPKDGVPDLQKKMDKKIDLDSSFEIFEGKKKRFSFLPDLESQDTFVLSQDDIIEFPKQGKRNNVSFDSELESQDTSVSSQDTVIKFPKHFLDSELENEDILPDKYNLTFKRRNTIVFSPDLSFEACFGSPKHDILANADVADAGDINLDDSFDLPKPIINFDIDEDILDEDFNLDVKGTFSDNYVDEKKNQRAGFKRKRNDSIFFEDGPNDQNRNQRAALKRKRVNSFMFEDDPNDRKKNKCAGFKRKRRDTLFMSLGEDPNVSLMDSQDLDPNKDEAPGTSHWSNLKGSLKRGMALVKCKRKEMDEILKTVEDDGSESDFFSDDDDDSLFQGFPQDLVKQITQSIPREERLKTRNTV
ncbi:uncharacterized protein [Drosophila takahashii]|uniref:uncharacterized protein n=1 Tax=Drosophila takahashii TaxID=29030 RepID=UPI00389906CC